MRTTYCYNDLFSWGRELQAAIEKRKGAAHLFTHAQQVPDDHCVCTFLNMSAKERDYTKELNEELARQQTVAHIPTIAEGRLHDERVQQYRTFAAWMPTSYLFTSLEDVSKELNDLPYPLLSFPSARAEMNRRILENPEEAFTEAMNAFSDNGITLQGGGWQRKYVFWQIPVDRGRGHWHVFMAANRYAVITALGPYGKGIETVEILNEQLIELLKYVYVFTVDHRLNWSCVEVIAGADPVQKLTSPFVTSLSVSWPFAWFEQGGLVFETSDGTDWQSTGIPAVRIWDVVAEAILKGQFDG